MQLAALRADRLAMHAAHDDPQRPRQQQIDSVDMPIAGHVKELEAGGALAEVLAVKAGECGGAPGKCVPSISKLARRGD